MCGLDRAEAELQEYKARLNFLDSITDPEAKDLIRLYVDRIISTFVGEMENYPTPTNSDWDNFSKDLFRLLIQVHGEGFSKGFSRYTGELCDGEEDITLDSSYEGIGEIDLSYLDE